MVLIITERVIMRFFADHDIAYLFLGVAEHRFYHTPNDTFEKIDLNAFNDVVYESPVNLRKTKR